MPQFTLHTAAGDAVADVTECAVAGGHLYLLRAGDLWMFPALGSNSTIPVKVANRTYVVRNLSRQPKVRPLVSVCKGFITVADHWTPSECVVSAAAQVFEVADFVSNEEAAALRAASHLSRTDEPKEAQTCHGMDR